MRLPLILVLLVLASTTAMPLIAAESNAVCDKDVLLYLDVSNSMRVARAGGVSRLQIFTRAIRDLLAGTAGFLGEGDRVRLMTFSGKSEVPFVATIEGDALSHLSAELERLRGLAPQPQDDVSSATDLTLVLNDLEIQLTADRRTYVIIASDLIHDPENQNKDFRAERREAFLQRLADFRRRVLTKHLPEIIILDANVGSDVDADVGAGIREALIAAPLNAETIPVVGERAVTQQLKRKIGNPVVAAVVLRSENGKAQLALRVTNPNAFPVRLLHTSVDEAKTPVDRLIGCGSTTTIDISAPAGSQITAQFEVGDSATTPVRDLLDIDTTGARVLLNGLGKGTLLLQVHIRKFLGHDAKVDVEVDGQPKRSVTIRKGVADDPVTFAIPLPAKAPQLRADETVRARFTVSSGIALQDATSGNNAASREAETKTEGDWRDQVPRVILSMIIFLISWLLPGQGLVRRLFSAAMDADVLDLLPGPERYLNAGVAGACWFLPTYQWPGGWWAAYLNALPMALVAAMFVFYLLRTGALLLWALSIEPKGVLLPPGVAHGRLRALTAAIWACTLATLVVVMVSMAALVPNALAVAR